MTLQSPAYESAARGDAAHHGSDFSSQTQSPAQLLAALDAAWEGPMENPPKRLPLAKIEVLPQVFQLRALARPDEDHVEILRRAVRDQGLLDPVEVVPVGGRYFVIDGHHRLEAYRRTGGFPDGIPVRVSREGPSKAVLRAGKANSRPKLMMSQWERSEAAWKLVNLGSSGAVAYTKAEIADAATVSQRTVAYMRKTLRLLKENRPDVDPAATPWLEAKAIVEGRAGEWQPMTEEEVERLAEEYARRMEKYLGPKFARNPEVAAKALLKFSPRGASAIARALQDELGWDEFEGHAGTAGDDEEF